MKQYTPFYSTDELTALLRSWQHGGLDGIHSPNAVVVGVVGCDRPAKGFRAESLLQRFSSADVSSVFRQMATAAEPMPTYGAIVYANVVQCHPLQDLARAIGLADCSEAQSLLIRAEDAFMNLLLGHLVPKQDRGANG
jgi:hypothetical protein